MTKLLILDKDGTLVAPATGQRFVQHPQDQVVLPGVREAIAHYISQGATAVLVSNQGGVAAGHKRLEDAIAEMRYCLELLPDIQVAYFCPDFQGNQCVGVGQEFDGGMKLFDKQSFTGKVSEMAELFGLFRKPNPGMVNLAVLRHLRYYGHEKSNAVFVGDRAEDKEAAKSSCIAFIHAEDWRNQRA